MRKNVKNLAERCEAFVFDSYGVKLKGRCCNRRHFRINGKELCGRHTSLEAMHTLFKGGKVKMLVHKLPAMYGAVRTEYSENLK